MSSTTQSSNWREILSARNTVTGKQEYLTSTNGALNVNGSGGGGSDVQYTDGAAAPANPIGTIPVFNNGGTITAVSVANPLPVNASVSITGVATATNQTGGSQKTQIVDGSGNVIGSTSNALNVAITSGGGSGGTSSSFAATFPATGTAIGVKNGTTMVNLAADGSSNLLVNLNTAIPAGSNAIGSITNTSFAATQATASSLNATVVGTGTFAAQVTGIVTANAGTNLNTSALALDATLTGGNERTKITDGTTNAAVKAASTAAGATDPALVVAISPNNTVPVSLAMNTPTLQSGSTTTVTQGTASNLNATVVGTGTFATQATLAAETTKVIGTVNVASGQSIAVTNTGTFATQPTIQTGTNSIGKISDITTSVVPGTAATNLGKAEDAASASGDTGVFTLGVRNDTIADTTNTNGDYTQFSTDVKGHMMTANAPRALKTEQQTTITASTAETTVLTAVASTFLDVYGVIVANSSATAANVTFKDATAGTTRFNIYVPAGETRGFMLPMDAAHNQAAVNNNWTATSSASVTSLFITMLAVKNV